MGDTEPRTAGTPKSSSHEEHWDGASGFADEIGYLENILPERTSPNWERMPMDDIKKEPPAFR